MRLEDLYIRGGAPGGRCDRVSENLAEVGRERPVDDDASLLHTCRGFFGGWRHLCFKLLHLLFDLLFRRIHGRGSDCRRRFCRDKRMARSSHGCLVARVVRGLLVRVTVVLVMMLVVVVLLPTEVFRSEGRDRERNENGQKDHRPCASISRRSFALR